MYNDEAAFQCNVVNMLKETGFYVFAVPNGGSRNIKEAHNLKLQGVKAGVSDLIILLPKGQVYFVELKNPNGKGRQSPNQRAFEESVKGYGHQYLIWDKWPQVEQFINAHRKEVQEYLKIGGTNAEE